MNDFNHLPYWIIMFGIANTLTACTLAGGTDKLITITTDKRINAGEVIELDPQGLVTLLKYDKNTFIIDVRSYDTGIRKCKIIGDYDFIQDSSIYSNIELLPENRSIVLLSKKGVKSRQLARYLAEKGFTVYNLTGGMDNYWNWREQMIREKLKLYDKEIDVIELYADEFGC